MVGRYPVSAQPCTWKRRFLTGRRWIEELVRCNGPSWTGGGGAGKLQGVVNALSGNGDESFVVGPDPRYAVVKGGERNLEVEDSRALNV